MLLIILLLLTSFRWHGSTQIVTNDVNVDLDLNGLQRFPDNLNCKGVKLLDLSNSEISLLKKDDFLGCIDVRILHLHGNHLKFLQEDVFEFLDLHTISLHDNPWQCDCSLSWLSKWLETVTLEKDFSCSYSNNDKQIPFQHFVDTCIGASTHARNRRSTGAITVTYSPKEPENCSSLKYEVNTNMSFHVQSSNTISSLQLLVNNEVVKAVDSLQTLSHQFTTIGKYRLTIRATLSKGSEEWSKEIEIVENDQSKYDIVLSPKSAHASICTGVNISFAVESLTKTCIAKNRNYTWLVGSNRMYGEKINYVFNRIGLNSKSVAVKVSVLNVTIFLQLYDKISDFEVQVPSIFCGGQQTAVRFHSEGTAVHYSYWIWPNRETIHHLGVSVTEHLMKVPQSSANVTFIAENPVSENSVTKFLEVLGENQVKVVLIDQYHAVGDVAIRPHTFHVCKANYSFKWIINGTLEVVGTRDASKIPEAHITFKEGSNTIQLSIGNDPRSPYTAVLYVERKINFDLPGKSNAHVGKPFILSANNFEGSLFYHYRWIIDETTLPWMIGVRNDSLIFNKTFEEEKLCNVQLEVKNNISHVIRSSQVKVQNPLAVVRSNSNVMYAEVKGLVQIEINLKYASKFGYRVLLHDEKKSHKEELITMVNPFSYLMHPQEPGTYKITVILYDNLKNETVEVILHVLRKINPSYLNVTISNSTINIGESVDASALFSMDIKPISFKWFQQHSDDHPVLIGSGPNMPSYIFDKPGRYVIILEAENKISNYTHRMNLTVIHFIDVQLTARLPSGLTVTAPSNVAIVPGDNITFVGEAISSNPLQLEWFINDVKQVKFINEDEFLYETLLQGTYKITFKASTPYGWNVSSLEVIVQKPISSVSLQSFVANTSLVNNTVKHINYSHVFFEPSDVIGVSGSMHCNNTNRNVNFYQTNFSQHQMNVFVVPISSISGEMTCRVDSWNHVSSVSACYRYLVGRVPLLNIPNSSLVSKINGTVQVNVDILNTVIPSYLRWLINGEEISHCTQTILANANDSKSCDIRVYSNNSKISVCLYNDYFVLKKDIAVTLFTTISIITVSPLHVKVGEPTNISIVSNGDGYKTYFWNEFNRTESYLNLTLDTPQVKRLSVTVTNPVNVFHTYVNITSYKSGQFEISSSVGLIRNPILLVGNVEKGTNVSFFVNNPDPYSTYTWNFTANNGPSQMIAIYDTKQHLNWGTWPYDKVWIELTEKNPLSNTKKTVVIFGHTPIKISTNFTQVIVSPNETYSVYFTWAGSGLKNLKDVNVSGVDRFDYHINMESRDLLVTFTTSSQNQSISIHVNICGPINCDIADLKLISQPKVKNISVTGFEENVSVNSTIELHLNELVLNDTQIVWKLLNSTGHFIKILGNGVDLEFPATFDVGRYIVEVTVNGSSVEGSFLRRLFHVNIFQLNCQEPTVEFGTGKFREHVKSLWFYSEVNLSTNCENIKHFWRIRLSCQSVDPADDYEPKLPKGIKLITNKPVLEVPPRAFDVGNYCVEHTLSYGNYGEKVLAFHLSVKATPLVPVISGGSYRIIGNKQDIVIYANETIDPDAQFPNYLLEFRWIVENNCFHFNESHNNINIWNSSNFYVKVRSNCLAADKTYIIRLQARRHGETEFQEKQQKLHVVEGFAPLLEIECFPCKTYKSFKYERKRKLKLLARCSNCGDLETTYEWQVIGNNDTKQIPLTAENVLSPLSTATLVLEKFVLDGVQAYTIICKVTVNGMAAAGQTSLDLKQNYSPKNGICELSREEGQSMIDLFKIHCSGWEDADNENQPFLYWLLAGMSEDASNMSVLYRGIQNSMEVFLPLGSETNNWTLFVEVRVEDSLGAYTVANKRPVYVRPAEEAKENLTEFLTEKVMPLLKESKEVKDLNRMMTLVMASTAFLAFGNGNSTNQTSVLNTLVDSTTDIDASSVESISQITDALQMIYRQSEEVTKLSAESHDQTSSSLDSMVDLARSFSDQGINLEDKTYEDFGKLINNNMQYYMVSNSPSRLRRAVSELTNPLNDSYNTLQKLYNVILDTTVTGERDRLISTGLIWALLSRKPGKGLRPDSIAGPCSVHSNIKDLTDREDVLSVFECSNLDPYLNSPDRSISSLSFLDGSMEKISVQNISEDESIVLGIPNSFNDYHENSSIILQPNELHISTLNNFSQVPDLEHTGFHIVFDFTDAEDSSDGDIYIYFSENVPLSYDSTVVQKKVVNKYSDEESRTVFLSGSGYKAKSIYYYGLQNEFDSLVNITVTIYTSRCTFWNVSTNQWESNGCKPTGGTTRQKVSCKCNHLTSFTGSLELSPNPLDFSVLKKLDVSDNPVAVITCSVIVVLYLVALFFAYRKDRKEQNEEHVVHYIGSDEGFYQYEIRIKTGMYPWAGTTAHVGVQIFGTSCTTKVRVFKTEQSFMRNAVDMFRISLDRSIGKIYKVQVWHDNSGSDPSWYLERLVIRSLSNGEKFFFFCNRWIGVDCSDGMLEHEFHVADVHEMKKFSTIFFDVLARGLSDYHLWLSLFERPKFSRFTRIQRATCLVTLILSWMCVSAMWFQVAPEGKVDLYIGFKGYSIEELLIGMISVAMVFPLNLLLVFLFRKSKQGKVPEKRLKIWKPTRHMKQDLVDIDMVQLITEEATDDFGLGFTSSPIRRKKKCFNIHDLLEKDISDGMALNDLSAIDNLVLHTTSLLADSPTSSSPLTLPHSFAMNPMASNNQSDVYFTQPLQETGDNLVHITMQNNLEPEVDLFDEDFKEMNPPFDLPLLDADELRSHMTEIVEQQLSSIVHHTHENAAVKLDVGILSDYSSGIFRHDSVTASIVKRNEMLAEQLQIPDIIELDPVTRWYLPHWCIYVAYTFCFLISGLSIVIVITYGQQFGTDVSLKWLKSLLLGCLEDFLLAYPFVLLTVAFVLAMFVKPLDLDKVDHDDFVECADGKSVQYDSNMETLLPPSGYALELLQRDGLKMKRLRKFVKDVLFQALLMWFVLGICYSKYSTRWYETTKMFEKDLNYPMNIANVSKITDYWSWLNATFLPFAFNNHKNTNEWKMSSDPVIRQIRSTFSDCVAEKHADMMNIEFCSSSSFMEVTAFNNNWSLPLEEKFDEKVVASPWVYRRHKLLKTFGTIRTYPASGYEWRLHLSDGLQASQLALKNLLNHQWIDRSTRALVHKVIGLDTTALQYASITLLVEISRTGSMHTMFDLKYFPVKYFLTNLDYFSMFCMIMLSLLTVYMFVYLIRQIHTKNWGCLTTFWNVHLAVTMLTSMAALMLQVGHLFALYDFRDDLVNGYIPYGISSRSISFLDDVIMYVFGFLAFLVIARTVRLLRLLNVYEYCSQLLRNCTKPIVHLFFAHLLVVFGFSAVLMLTFQPYVYEYRNFWHSFLTVLFYRWSNQSVKETINSSRGLGMFWNTLWMLYWLIFAISFFKAVVLNSVTTNRANNGKKDSLLLFIWKQISKLKRKPRHVHFIEVAKETVDEKEDDEINCKVIPQENIPHLDLPPLPYQMFDLDSNLITVLADLDQMLVDEEWEVEVLNRLRRKFCDAKAQKYHSVQKIKSGTNPPNFPAF